MPARHVRALLAVALVAAPLAAVGTASAVGPGTFTKVTTPASGLVYPYDGNGANPLTISGMTSADVANVDLLCLYSAKDGIHIQPFATNVPVTGGVFSTTTGLSRFPTNCRLRAVPTGVDPTTSYLGSYTGPVLYFNTVLRAPDPDNTVAYQAFGEQGTGYAVVEDAGTCGATTLTTFATPAMDQRGPARDICGLFFPAGDFTNSPTASSTMHVDGRSAWLPSTVSGYLNGALGLGVTQPLLSTHFSRHPNGDLTVTESAPLMRCSGDEVKPPTPSSCPDLVGTGVTFTRTADILHGAHQIRFRDSYSSTDAAVHTVAPQYVTLLVRPPTGELGYLFPGQSSFAAATTDQVVTGLGTKAASLFSRYDIDAAADDPDVDTTALSWSRAPSQVRFGHSSTAIFAMLYSFGVPASGKAYLGFAVSEAVATSAAKSLAAAAVREVMVTPTITSPKPGATVRGHRTTVKGTVSLGANGLPRSVTVSGHRATLTKLSDRRASYVATFSQPFGRHTLTVTATDAAGNTASIRRTVRNVAPS